MRERERENKIMVFEKESLPYVLYVGQGVNALEGQFDKAYDQIKKSKFDFFCLPLYNENADRARSNQIDTKQVNIQSGMSHAAPGNPPHHQFKHCAGAQALFF